MKLHSELPYLLLHVNFVAKISKVHVEFAVKRNIKPINIHSGHHNKKRNLQKSAKILISFFPQIASKLTVSVQLTDSINFLNAMNGFVKFSVTRNRQMQSLAIGLPPLNEAAAEETATETQENIVMVYQPLPTLLVNPRNVTSFGHLLSLLRKNFHYLLIVVALSLLSGVLMLIMLLLNVHT